MEVYNFSLQGFSQNAVIRQIPSDYFLMGYDSLWYDRWLPAFQRSLLFTWIQTRLHRQDGPEDNSL